MIMLKALMAVTLDTERTNLTPPTRDIASDIFRIAGIASIILYSMHMFIAKLITAPLHTLGTDYWINLDTVGERLILLIVTLSILYLITFAVYRMKRTLGESTDTAGSPSTDKL